SLVVERIESLVDERISVRYKEYNKEIDKEREDAIADAHKTIEDKVWENYDNLIAMYGAMYPGADVTSMVKDYLDDATKKAIKDFDVSVIDTEIDKARTELIKTAADWEWYVLDRDSHYSFRDYQSSADKMETIASVFPVFFMLIAALVCLTTMTRMVEEQRELIGTFKALGYKKSSIAFKYIIYSLVASLTGGIAGCAVGIKIFPVIIYYCWGIMYDLPDIMFGNHWLLSIVAIGLMVLVIEASTIYACYNELMEVPAILMRPKAPRKGKKIFLERLSFVWKRMSFSNKVTARNIFRYKKRFFMTVVGVAGGCALMMTGYGLKDSISVLITKQFHEILKYDMSVTFDDDTVGARLRLDDKVKSAISYYNYATELIKNEGTDEEVTISNVSVNVINDYERFGDFVTFRKRNTNTVYEFTSDGVFISEKTAKDLKVKANDTFILENENGEEKEVTVAKVIEMYTGHHIYMTSEYYRSIYDENVQSNAALAILNDISSDEENILGQKYIDMDGVKGVTFYSGSIDRFNTMISTINLVTYILIASAAALSFVVLYNLTNVNVSERIREIATIKVLGFYNNEVDAYVYRENIVISVIGAIIGLGLGVVLHHFIMLTLEFDDMMFGNVIKPMSYLISFAFTMLFSVLVNWFMRGKLRRIKMVESLKSVE
ncbi:MAG: ABC transporter permease, partial [Lachnospira sp.]|nr:ABC transporter permease [Lachnospira sp.]